MLERLKKAVCQANLDLVKAGLVVETWGNASGADPLPLPTASKEGGAVKGIFLGPLKGIGMTVMRTLAGAGELATFFVPYPGFYDPFIEPQYVWENEK